MEVNWKNSQQWTSWKKKQVDILASCIFFFLTVHDDNITKQILQWTPKVRRKRDQRTPKKRDLEKEVFQVNLENDRGGRTGQDRSGLWNDLKNV